MSETREIRAGWSEGGGGLIVDTGHGFVLYEVPQYGGEPEFRGHFLHITDAKQEAESWT